MLPRNASGLPALFGDLVRLEIELWDAVEARLTADHELTLARFLAMQVIGRRPGCRVQDIAADLAITVGGTSKVVDRVAAAGHCVRTPNPDDRRSSLIALTPAGERLLRDAETTFADELRRRIGGVLTGDGLAAFVATLGALRAAVRQEKTA
jgi:MarR family transcriptional regulator, organic hydroperoxide resistance regulator